MPEFPLIEIRPYRASDLDGVVDLFLRAVRETASADYNEKQIDVWAQADPDEWALARASRPTWVAFTGGKLAGFADLEKNGLIDMMFVHPDHQRKGVATALGVFLAVCWPAAGAAVILFILVALFYRYVSLASISAAAALPLLIYILYAPGHAPPTAVSVCTLLAAVIVIAKHRDNIERLLAGTEPRFEMGRKKT